MRKYMLIGLLILLLLTGVMLGALAQSNVNDAVEVSRDDLRVTVYNDGLALVQDTRTFELAAGDNHLTFSGITEQIVMNTVMVMNPENPASLTPLQQNYVAPALAITTEALIEANIGQQVTLINRQREALTGLLVSARSDIILQDVDGQVLVIDADDVDEFNFPMLPEAGSTQPGLDLLVNSADAGEMPITLFYITRGLSWVSTDYNLNIGESGASREGDIALTGWVTVTNNTSIALDDAEITLAAGSFDRLQFVSRDVGYVSATATPQPTPQGQQGAGTGNVGGGTLPQTGGGTQQEPGTVFYVDQRITLAAGETKLLEFLPEADANARNVYIYDASPRVFNNLGYNVDPTFGATGVTAVQNFLEFSTDEEDGLGTALPAGGMRIFEQNDEGVPLLIGDTAISYTPENETVRLFLDDDADLRGERRQTEFLSLSADAVQETFEIHLFNDKQAPVTVTVPERLARSPNFEVVASNTPFEQSTGGIITFDVEVPAGADVTISYTVQYRRPQ